MQHSKPLSPLSAYQLGFTLIEVMVGVAIFAILSAMIVASIQSNADRNAKLEAQRFIAVVNSVRDEALISGKTLTLEMDEKGANYSFAVYGAEDKGAGPIDTLFRSRHLHKSVTVKWEILDQLVDEGDEFESEADSDNFLEERAFITPLGELTPIEVRFQGDDNDYVVALDDEGLLALTTRISVSYTHLTLPTTSRV